MTSFEHLLFDVLHHGETRTSRTGLSTQSLFAPDPIRYDLTGGKLALISSKKVPWKMALREFMWMLSGSTNVETLRKSSPAMAQIWENWADNFGSVGPTYGAQYRNAGGSLDEWLEGTDQLAEVIDRLEATPDTRRALISLWSAPELSSMEIEPCMVLFQFERRGPNLEYLDLHVYQRSADMMLGVPFDLFQASILMHLIARELRLRGHEVDARRLVWSAGDVHLYENQLGPAQKQLEQWANLDPQAPAPTVYIDQFPSLHILDGTLEPSHITVQNYNPQPPVDGGKIAV